MSTVITVIEKAKIDAINQEHRLCEAAYGNALEHALNCGRMLAAVKADLRHGDWLPWVAENFDGSERTARVYMQLAAAPQIEDRQSAADLPVSIAAALRDVSRPAPRPSPRDAVAAVSHMEDDEDDTPDRPAPAPEMEWTEQHSRRRQRILTMLDEARAHLEQASTPGLAPHTVAELLRSAEIEARRASAQTGELAFAFER